MKNKKFFLFFLLLGPAIGYAYDQTGHLWADFPQAGWTVTTTVTNATNCDINSYNFTTDGKTSNTVSSCQPGGTTLAWTSNLVATKGAAVCNYTLPVSCKVNWATGKVSNCSINNQQSPRDPNCFTWAHAEQNGSTAYILAVYNPPVTPSSQ